LPAQAALQVELADTARVPAETVVAALAGLPGVAGVRHEGAQIDISLHATTHAAPVLRWLDEQGHALAHFSTARTKLEDIFLSLTGRTLRD
jgi:ABC-2 type transport system ATP-binding protein